MTKKKPEPLDMWIGRNTSPEFFVCCAHRCTSNHPYLDGSKLKLIVEPVMWCDGEHNNGWYYCFDCGIRILMNEEKKRVYRKRRKLPAHA